jgi:hypothetical protein
MKKREKAPRKKLKPQNEGQQMRKREKQTNSNKNHERKYINRK